MNNSENCCLKSTSSPTSSSLSSSSTNETTPKQSSFNKLITRLTNNSTTTRSHTKLGHEQPQRLTNDLKRSNTNVDAFTKIMIHDDPYEKDEMKDVCNALLRVNNSSSKSNRSNSMLVLTNSSKKSQKQQQQQHRRNSFSSLLFESASFSTDLNLIANLQAKRDRRRSSGLLRSKNLLNQIKSIDYASETLDLADELELEKHKEEKQVLTSIKSNNMNKNSSSSDNRKETTLDIIANIYNSELNYLKLLKYTFEIYAEPLRKFSSLTPHEHNLLFSNLEPILSLSLNLSIKLENLIKNCPFELNNSGKIFGKKLLQCYEEYLNNYPSIIKLLNQKLKQIEIKEFCELRQSNSECQIALKDLLSAPLERIQYYEKSLELLNESLSSCNNNNNNNTISATTSTIFSSTTTPIITTNKILDHNQLLPQNNKENYLKITNKNNNNETNCANNQCTNQQQDIEIIKRRKKTNRPFSTTHLFHLSSTNNNTNKQNNSLISELTYNLNSNQNIPSLVSSTSLYFNESNYISWNSSNTMKEKSESLINLNNGHSFVHASQLELNNRLSSLACIQQTFPHDDLKLFDNLNTNFNSTTSSTTAATTTKTKFNLNNTTPSRKSSLLNFIHQPNRRKTILVNEQTSGGSSSNQASSESKQDDLTINNNNTNRKKLTSSASFVSKHFLLQRRKTIHDIVDFDTLISTSPVHSEQQQLKTDSDLAFSSLVLPLENANSTTDLITPKSCNSDSASLLTTNSRILVKHGHVQLFNQYGKQDRLFFLFSDLLIIAKQKNENHNKLKHRILVSDIWLSETCFDTIYWQYRTETSFVIGWPPAFNFIADFKDSFKRDAWLIKFKELIAKEKKKQQDLSLNIKICFNRDNLGGTEPTQYSQCFTKTVQVKANDTAQDIVNRCKYLFNLEESASSSSSTSLIEQTSSSVVTTTNNSNNNNYQLWLKTAENEPLIPLIGHEFPFVIKMNFLREAHRSIKDDDNSYKFILIDKNATRQQAATSKTNSKSNHSNATSSSSHAASKTNIHSTDADFEDKLQKLRKKIFWPRTNPVSKSNTFNQHLNSLISSPSSFLTHPTSSAANSLLVNTTFKQEQLQKSPTTALTTTTTTTQQACNEFNTKLAKKLKQSENTSSTSEQFRSNSLNYVNTFLSNNFAKTKENNNNEQGAVDSAPNGTTSSSSSSSLSMSSKNTHTTLTEPIELNTNSTTTTMATVISNTKSQSLTNTTLRPFYNKLKKTHLFGVKLDKLMGAYNPQTNYKLPPQIINLMEKVATEGSTSLMIFRKSASAKLKKTYKEKLDTNHAVDYSEMNVHVAALLLKEYLRDYPDGIIDYRSYGDMLATLKLTDAELKAQTTQALLGKLPKWNFVCLKHFMCLFSCILINSQINKMDSHNIAVCVAPSIFHKLDRPSDVASSFQAIAFIKYLIDNCELLFGSDLYNLLNASQKLFNLNINNNKTKMDLNSDGAVTSLSSFTSSIEPTPNVSDLKDATDKPIKAAKSKKSSEFGRMLNLVKGRKSLSNSLSKSSSVTNAAKKASLTQIATSQTQTDSTRRVDEQKTSESSIDHLDLIPASSSKLRRRTSTNNGNSSEPNGSILIINDEDDDDDEHQFEIEHDDLDYDDEEEEEDLNDDDDEEFNELISHQFSKRRTNQRNTNVTKLKSKLNQQQQQNGSNLTSVINNNNNNNNTAANKQQHDLSSNTLSVDSGLSVPTATNSDPESEKSALQNRNFEEKLKLEIDNLKNFYLTTTNEFGEALANKLIADETSKQQLKRQRRMLVLKVDDESVKPMAPHAPPSSSSNCLSDETEEDDDDVESNKSINKHILIPYNTDTLPQHYQKSTTSSDLLNSSKKRIAPTVSDLINQTSALALTKLENFDSLIAASSCLNKSTDLNKSTSTSNSKQTQLSTSTSRKQLVKIDLLVDNLSSNSTLVANAISSGVGLARLNELDFYKSNLSKLEDDSSVRTDIFIKIPTEVEESSSSPTPSMVSSSNCDENTLTSKKRNNSYKLANSQAQRRKLSKTLKDYKPSKHFVENNLKSNGFQPIKKSSAVSSSSSGADLDDDDDDDEDDKTIRKSQSIKSNKKPSSQCISRSSSGTSAHAVNKTQTNSVQIKKSTAKRSSSIQVNQSANKTSFYAQQQLLNKNQTSKEIRRSISLKNKLDDTTNKPLPIKLNSKYKNLTSESSAFKPVAANLFKQQQQQQLKIPYRNNSTLVHTAYVVSSKKSNYLNSNSGSSVSSVSLIAGSTQQRRNQISNHQQQQQPLPKPQQLPVEVTWSVSNIKKKFEPNYIETSTSSTSTTNSLSSSTNKSAKSSDLNEDLVYLQAYKDSNGNSVTYI